MSDEPPDYIDWHDDRSGPSFFGCVGMAMGLLFMLTGGICVWGGASGGGTELLLIGLLIMAGGWALSRGR